MREMRLCPFSFLMSVFALNVTGTLFRPGLVCFGVPLMTIQRTVHIPAARDNQPVQSPISSSTAPVATGWGGRRTGTAPAATTGTRYVSGRNAAFTVPHPEVSACSKHLLAPVAEKP
jgi:hypothetical protein